MDVTIAAKSLVSKLPLEARAFITFPGMLFSVLPLSSHPWSIPRRYAPFQSGLSVLQNRPFSSPKVLSFGSSAANNRELPARIATANSVFMIMLPPPLTRTRDPDTLAFRLPPLHDGQT